MKVDPLPSSVSPLKIITGIYLFVFLYNCLFYVCKSNQKYQHMCLLSSLFIHILRYHVPVKGVLSEPKLINGEYYTVNPMAIRSQLDVYGENKRVVSTIQSPEFGTVAYVAIGAMMVGSIVLTTKAGQAVERMDEHGYFAFG